MFNAIRRDASRVMLLAGSFVALIAAGPAWSADFRIDDLKLDLGSFTITAPRIEVKGSPLEKDAFLALFGGSANEPASARMGRLTATEITAPELSMAQTIGAQKQVTVYRDLRLSDVVEGKAARGEAASGTIAVTGAATGPAQGAIKRIGLEGLDIRQIARVLTEKAQPGVVETLQPVVARFEQDGYSLDLGAGGKMTMGRSSGYGFSAKVGDEPLIDLLGRVAALSQAAEAQAKLPEAQRDPALSETNKRIGLSMLSLLDTIDYGSGEIRDIVMNVLTPPSPGDKAVPVDMRLARIAYGAETPAKSGFAMEKLQFAGGGAKGALDLLAYSGFSLGTSVKELRDLLARPTVDLDSYDYRKLIPTLGKIQMKGLAVEVPQAAQAPATKPGPSTNWGAPATPAPVPAAAPMKIGLGNFELALSDQINGVPSAMALTIDNITVPVVPGPANPASADLLAMGYRMLDLSAKLDLAWDAARNELAIRSLSLGGADMVRLDASGTLANVTRDIFSSDLALAQVAALGATVRGIEAKLQNFGLIEKLIDNEARKGKRKPEDVRREYAMMASLGLAAILGPSDAAKALTSAVSRFAAKPGLLTVQATSKASGGLGLADVIALGDPTEIFTKIDLKANAQ